jgi:5-methyltetrahydropteroyltriglutamate--homocysteine methyltransferase
MSTLETQAEGTVRARVPARAESVGSLLRSEEMKSAFASAYGNLLHVDLDSEQRRSALAELERLAAAATPDLVRRQIEAGLDVVTDGELRRGFFVNSLMDAVDGIEMETEETSDDHPGEPVPLVTGRISKKGNPALAEARELVEITPFPKKITFPAASFFYLQMVIDISPDAYSAREEFVDAIVEVQRDLVAEVVAAGVEHIQFDFPVYPLLVDEMAAARTAEMGETPESLLDKALAADEKMVAGLPDEVTTGLHICRGNQIRFFSGSLEPLAERLFALPYDRFLIEMHDTEADGPYDPIRFVPDEKVMVMGLLSTQSPELEDEDELLRRMDEASNFLDLSQLAISPQCGFASTWRGHGYGEDVQWSKLELIGRVADRLWGSR